MASDCVQTGRCGEKFTLSSTEYHVLLNVSQGFSTSATMTLHIAMSSNQARELAYRLLAHAEAVDGKKETK
jgi:hypothetical protein